MEAKYKQGDELKVVSSGKGITHCLVIGSKCTIVRSIVMASSDSVPDYMVRGVDEEGDEINQYMEECDLEPIK